MNQPIAASSVAISIVSAFVRYALPAIPSPIAWSGVASGLIILLAGAAMPQLNFTIPAMALFLFGMLCIGGAIKLALPKDAPSSGETAVSEPPKNSIGNIKGNQGIVTQGQKGDNSIQSK